MRVRHGPRHCDRGANPTTPLGLVPGKAGGAAIRESGHSPRVLVPRGIGDNHEWCRGRARPGGYCRRQTAGRPRPAARWALAAFPAGRSGGRGRVRKRGARAHGAREPGGSWGAAGRRRERQQHRRGPLAGRHPAHRSTPTPSWPRSTRTSAPVRHSSGCPTASCSSSMTEAERSPRSRMTCCSRRTATTSRSCWRGSTRACARLRPAPRDSRSRPPARFSRSPAAPGACTRSRRSRATARPGSHRAA